MKNAALKRRKRIALAFGLLLMNIFAGTVSYEQCNELIWADEFDYTGLPDNTKWSYEVGGSGWGNNELQYYTSNRLENARVADGILTIEARKESYGGRNYSSARLVSRQKGDWLYGRIEVRAKLPSGRGTWPAIWMMPTESAYGTWPNSGEMDIMEHVGYNPNVVHATIHTDLYNGAEGTQKGSSLTVADAFTAFHVYAMEWTPTQLKFYIDNSGYFTYDYSNDHRAWPFDKMFYLIMNIAVGGNWGGAQGIDDTVFPARMEIDYVRVYQDASKQGIQGIREVFQNELAIRYSLMAEEGRTFNWTVPPGAAIVSGQGTHSVLVNWGCEGGNLQCRLTTACDQYDLVAPVTIKPYVLRGPYFVTDNETGVWLIAPNVGETQYAWTLPGDAALISGQGNDTLIFNWGTGRNTVRLSLENACGTEEISRTLRPYGQYPYPDPDSPHSIPGTISPEQYDFGGEGVAYHDATPGNAGPGPRSDESVDTEILGSAVDVGWIDGGEWLEYSIQVQQAGTYYFSALTASQNLTNRGPMKVLVNGVTKLNTVPIYHTTSWSIFFSTDPLTLTLAPTDTLLRIETGAGGFNLGMIRLEDHLPTEIKEKQTSELLLYPVPVSNRLYIKNPQGITKLSITDITGSVRLTVNPSDQGVVEYELDMSSFPAGLYFLTLTDSHHTILVRKMVKQ